MTETPLAGLDSLEATTAALLCAYALVATADAELASSEIERLAALIEASGRDSSLVAVFTEVARALERDDGLRAGALERIAGAGLSPEAAAEVRAAAQVAIVADGHLRDQEEVALEQIEAALAR